MRTALKRVASKRVAVIAGLLVLAVALCTAVGTTFAYFTTYATAKGTIVVPLEERTEINEEFGSWTKHVSVTNSASEDGTSRAVFVRAKGFSGTSYPLVYTADANWTPGENGYYYYRLPLAPGETTSTLDVKITGVPEDAAQGDQFNVVVVYETTPVLYDESGQPYADWDVILDNGNLEGGE